MSQLDLTAATAAVLDRRWHDDTGQTPWRAHNRHNYNSDCAVCRGDVAAMLAVALPVLREQIAQQIVDCAKDVAATDSLDAVVGLMTAKAIVSGRLYADEAAFAQELCDVHGEHGQNRVNYYVVAPDQAFVRGEVTGQ